MPSPRPIRNAARFRFERRLLQKGIEVIAGVDEAGRGPLAGPVVAAAVVFPRAWIQSGLPRKLRGLNDSKQLTAEVRDHFFDLLGAWDGIGVGVGIVDVETIDRVNILRASHLAMYEALTRLISPPQHVLVDGLPVASLAFEQTSVVNGDGLSYSIAAASILAKVTRDRIMLEYDRQYPDYGFVRHKGYATPEHLEALRLQGPCPIHRRSFAPVRNKQGELFEGPWT